MNARNLTSPRARWRRGDPMAEHDRLPCPLRRWAATAALPWSAVSLRRAWTRALAKSGGDPAAALDRLAAAEARTLAREAGAVWGADHPAAALAPARGGG